MPAIASLEDLKAAQEESLRMTLCSMRSALCEKLVTIEKMRVDEVSGREK